MVQDSQNRISPSQMREIWTLFVDTRDPKVREDLALFYLPLVKKVLNRLCVGLPPHISREDLESEGVIGLLSAIDTFDPGRDVKFETFASLKVRGRVIDHLRSQDWVPRSLRGMSIQLRRTTDELEGRLGRSPEPKELADELGLSMDDYNKAVYHVSNVYVLPLEMPLTSVDGENFTLADSISDPQVGAVAGLQRDQMRVRLSEAIGELPEKQQMILSLYYVDGLTLKEIGSILGVTESRVSQIHKRVVIKLRALLEGDEELLDEVL